MGKSNQITGLATIIHSSIVQFGLEEQTRTVTDTQLNFLLLKSHVSYRKAKLMQPTLFFPLPLSQYPRPVSLFSSTQYYVSVILTVTSCCTKVMSCCTKSFGLICLFPIAITTSHPHTKQDNGSRFQDTIVQLAKMEMA